jgi:protein-tyrosine phosphatase
MKVLFVCTGNACRSPLADALLRKIRPDIEVDSAGTYPYYKVVDLTRKYAEKEKATEFLKVVPDGLESKDLNKFDIIVVMEKNHEKVILEKNPNLEDKIVVWNITDPYQLQFKQACQVFDKIKSKVAKLAKGL